MKILGIETSCDETSIALVEAKSGKFSILKNLVSSQIKIHQKYGGVVPEVAAREHIQKIIPLLNTVIKSKKDFDLIAVTAGPGLITALMVGLETAKTLAYAWNKPVVGINHLEGHIYSNWLVARGTWHGAQDPKPQLPKFPALILIVSGGHTELILMKNRGQYKLIGQTRDDAAGEAFDKVAKLLKLGYPGGPAIEKMAKKGNPKAFDFPRPMIEHKNFDFSFAGLKTAVLYEIRSGRHDFNRAKVKANLCASFQQAVVDVLVAKTIRAAKQIKPKTIMLAGGVAANKKLREIMKKEISKKIPNSYFLTPNSSLCTDNAAMIAAAGYFHALEHESTDWRKIKVDPNWELM